MRHTAPILVAAKSHDASSIAIYPCEKRKDGAASVSKLEENTAPRGRATRPPVLERCPSGAKARNFRVRLRHG